MRDAFALLTTFGRRGGRVTARALGWFPAVGAALGALLGAWWWVAERWWPALLAATLVVVADLAATGMLHVDGLCDTADGVLPHARSRDHRLAVMRAPDAGAFGVTVVAAALVLRVAAIAGRAPDVLLLAALWCAARSVVASVPAQVPCARDDGMAAGLATGAPRWPALAVVPAAAIAWASAGGVGAAAVAACAAAALAVVVSCARRLGGFTGDVLGAAIVVGETAGLVVAAARW